MGGGNVALAWSFAEAVGGEDADTCCATEVAGSGEDGSAGTDHKDVSSIPECLPEDPIPPASPESSRAMSMGPSVPPPTPSQAPTAPRTAT